jgi:hypothetical protein
MKQTVWAMVIGAGLLGLAYAGSLPSAQADAACGGKGQTPCPLQGWMEKEMDPLVEKSDTKGLAAAFEKVAKFSPDPKWNTGDPNWAAISKAGAEAAKKGDLAAAKAQCKSCHKAFREKYKTSFRTTALPK